MHKVCGVKRMLLVAGFWLLVSGSLSFGQTNYYSKSSGDLDLQATWGTNTDGSGSAPANFTTANQVFNVRNNLSPSINNNWTVSGAGSKIIIGDGTTSCVLTIPSSFILTGPTSISNN